MIKVTLSAVDKGFHDGINRYGRLVLSFTDLTSDNEEEIYWSFPLELSTKTSNSVILDKEQTKHLIEFLSSRVGNDDFPNEYEKQIVSKKEEIKKLKQDMNFLRESLVFSTKQTEALEKKIRDTREKIWDTFKELHE